jgi:uncharacterized protein (TIGR03435 family)
LENKDKDHFRPLLQKLLSEKFKVSVHREQRELMSYIAKPVLGTSSKLVTVDAFPTMSVNKGVLSGRGPFSILVRTVEGLLGAPVIDESGLTKNYTYDLKWKNGDKDSLMDALEEQMGVQLLPAQRKIEVIVVDRAEKLSKGA